mmetsp:Transcript_5434/g.13238  ORF Transcript_5434/g.13238 Transcript_5434/m.13238 type:complete len:129 (+) Transcript_5434:175-561(+)
MQQCAHQAKSASCDSNSKTLRKGYKNNVRSATCNHLPAPNNPLGTIGLMTTLKSPLVEMSLVKSSWLGTQLPSRVRDLIFKMRLSSVLDAKASPSSAKMSSPSLFAIKWLMSMEYKTAFCSGCLVKAF